MSDNQSQAAKTIAFQGAPGAYSDMACREVYSELRTMPCKTFTDAFAAVAGSWSCSRRTRTSRSSFPQKDRSSYWARS